MQHLQDPVWPFGETRKWCSGFSATTCRTLCTHSGRTPSENQSPMESRKTLLPLPRRARILSSLSGWKVGRKGPYSG